MGKPPAEAVQMIGTVAILVEAARVPPECPGDGGLSGLVGLVGVLGPRPDLSPTRRSARRQLSAQFASRRVATLCSR